MKIMKRLNEVMINNIFKTPPLGAVEPTGFLRKQLELQKSGITGHMEEYPDYGPNSGWLGGDGESWERGPYYVRGLTALAYALKDTELIKKAEKWLAWAVDSQREDGNFGPLAMEKEWWAKMPMLMAVKDWYEAENFALRYEHSEKILNFFEKYFSFQLKNLPSNPLDSWARARGGDNVYVVLWYYDEIKRVKGEEKIWLRDLAELLISQTEDWPEIFENTKVRHHVVNTTQAMKTPYLKYRLTGDKKYKEALKAGFENISKDHGRIDKLPNADEAARDNLPYRGTESCAVVEGMLSMEICGEISGESYLYDILESYCYNSLPNVFTYDLRLHTYYQMQNEVMAVQGYHGFDCDHGDSSAFGAPCGFDCCFSNSHMGFPKFVQNMWGETEKGIVLLCYGPNNVELTKGGKKLRFRQETEYPFKNKVKLVYEGEEAFFSLMLRIPEWAYKYCVSEEGKKTGDYITIERTFKPGDEITIKFDSKIEVREWHNNGRYVKKGVLLYCLPIKEDYRVVEHNQFREIKYDSHQDGPCVEIFPMSRWNYALYSGGFEYEENENLPEQPFSPKDPPCFIKAKGQIMKSWKIWGNNGDVFDREGVEENAAEAEGIILIPYGSSRLKISVFPKVTEKSRRRDVKPFSIKAETAFECVQVDFPRIEGAGSYTIHYGKESGKYNFSLCGVEVNRYKGGGHMFSREKYAFTFPGKGRIYIKMDAVSNGKIIAESEEIYVDMT